MSDCESTRGQWGGVCPGCGQRLPARQGPLRSWKSQRDAFWGFGTVTGRRWSAAQRAAYKASTTFGREPS